MRFSHFMLLLLLFTFYSTTGKTQLPVPSSSPLEKSIAAQAVKSDAVYGYNRFSNKVPFAVKDSAVTFFLRGRQQAKQVLLAGNFTDWQNKALRMALTDSGWTINVKLMPGKHLYKFIVDNIWETDADNLLSETDQNGYVNSVYFHPSLTFTLPSFTNAKTVFLLGSFNNWQARELSMLKTATGWKLPLYLSNGTHAYRYMVDGKIYVDPTNKDRLVKLYGPPSSYITIGKPDDLQKAFRSYQNSMAGRQSFNEKKAIISQVDRIGVIQYNQRDYPAALKTFQRAIFLSDSLKIDSLRGGIFLHLAQTSHSMDNVPMHLKYLQDAVKAYEKPYNEAGLAHAYRLLGYYYLNWGGKFTYNNPEKAVENFQKALGLFERLKKENDVALIHGNLGHAYSMMGNHTKWYDHTIMSLKLNEKTGNKQGQALCYLQLSNYVKGKKDFDKASEYLQNALTLSRQAGVKNVSETLIAFGYLYMEAPDVALQKLGINPAERLQKATETFKKSLQLLLEFGPSSRQLATLNTISETYTKANIYDSAYHYYRQYIDLRDKIINAEKQKDITRLEARLDHQKKEDSLRLENLLTDEKLQKQLLLAKQQEQQLSLQQQQITLVNKEKDLQHLAYLKMQTDLQNEQLEKEQKEKQLSLTQKEKQLQAARVKALTQEQAISRLSRQRQWIYSIGGLLVLAFGFLFFLHRSRLRSMQLQSQLVKEKAEQEQKESEFQRRVADISLTALRSQMNPHFIFNCLNSIKLYTLQSDTSAASEYLTKFSKLIRLVLENSRNERITLASELKALELYIQMEAMRFKEKLQYTITVAAEVETDYIEIPPLLLQPYVENAIWHGLMHKEKGGQIDITVDVQEEQSLLEIIITDDGIGRAKAAAIKSNTTARHRSYGMKATADRIALINQVYKAGANVSVHDLVDAEGQPAGTQVIMQIPI